MQAKSVPRKIKIILVSQLLAMVFISLTTHINLPLGILILAQLGGLFFALAIFLWLQQMVREAKLFLKGLDKKSLLPDK